VSDVYLFNASNDSALACNSLSYSPTRFVKCFESDLAVLPFLFARKDDIVLVDEYPTEKYLVAMQSFGFELPHFITKDDFFKKQRSQAFQLHAIKPWGWSRTVHTIFRSVKSSFSFQSPCLQWNEKLRELSGRQTAALILELLLKEENPLFIAISAVSKAIHSLDAFPELFLQRERWVLKSPWSSSGRGLMRISPSFFDVTEKSWAHGVIKDQGFVMLEPWFEKLFDFSILFSITKTDISLLCFSRFKTNDKGQFMGSYVHWDENLLLNHGIVNEQLQLLAQSLIEALKVMEYQNYYEGWLGVDAMIVREKGKILIHPCV
jgi:hypothetical protein